MGVINLGILIDKLKKVFVKKDSLDTDLSELGYVKNTDYASGQTGGVVRVSAGNGSAVSSGILVGAVRTQEQYTSANVNTFICKGTLENVKTNLLTSAMIDYAKNQIIAQANDVYAIRLVYDGTDWSIIAQKTN